MFTKRRIYELTATVLFFFFGIAFEYFFGLQIKNFTDFVLILIVFSLAFIITILIDIFSHHGNHFHELDQKLNHIISHPIIKIEFLEDQNDGTSFDRTREIIEKATKKLFFVSPWEPNSEFVSGLIPQAIGNAKRRYYEAIQKQIEKHRGSETFLHKRIIQVPPEIYEKPKFTYKTDSTFVDYINFAVSEQVMYPRNCQVKIVTRIISSHFTIVDDRYIILITYGYYKNSFVIRNSAVIIDDGEGKLIKYYNLLFQTLEANSRPVELQHIILK